MAKLTTRTLATGVTTSDLIHIVIPSDISQDPAGSSYKASIQQLFDSITGYCISDLYVTNIHGCSPITVWDDTYFLSNQIIQSPTPSTYTGFTSSFNGISSIYNQNTDVVHTTINFNNGSDAQCGFYTGSNTGSTNGIGYYYCGSGFTRSGVTSTGSNFYRNKGVIKGGRNIEGFVINPNGGNNDGTLWFEINGSATTILKGDGNSPTTSLLGLGLNFDGTEDPTATLQVGGTGSTGTFKYVDGNQQNGYVLTSDNDGNATWQPSSGGGSVFTGGTVNGPTNFTNGLSANTISATTYYNLPGSSSGNCFVDFYVRNVHGCSPISIWDETQTNGSNAYGTLSFSLGSGSKTYGNYSHANGNLTETGSNNGYLLTGCTAGVCTLNSSYGDVSANFTPGSTSFVFFDDTNYSNVYVSQVFSVSAVTFDGTYTIVYLDDITVDTLGTPAIISDTNPPPFWGGDQVFGGDYANATGARTQAIGYGSTAQGTGSYSLGEYSFAKNYSSAIGPYSSSEGKSSYSYGVASHAEGNNTYAIGVNSHAEGLYTTASGNNSHAEGSGSQAIGLSSHAEGVYSVASGIYSHSEGSSTASGIFSHAQGDSSVASGQYAHSQNKGTQAIGGSSHAGGFGGKAGGEVSFSHGFLTEANGPNTVTLGGLSNTVTTGGTMGSAILGGSGNTITYLSPTDDVSSSAIIGGSGNTVNSFESVLVGGHYNTVSGSRSVVLGGTGINATGADTAYVPNFVITESYTPTSSADTAGEPGSITWDNTYLYYKTNTGWRRINGSTF